MAGVEKPTDGEILEEVEIAYKPQYIESDFDGTAQEYLFANAPTYGSNIFNSEVGRPLALDNLLDKKVKKFSGGELQRLALAVTLSQDADIYLFDEPTAHLDIETEYELKNNMLPLLDDHLVFFATHRLHWMKNMDQIIVLDQGRIAEMGTHEDLMMKRGHYYQLVQNQGGKTEAIK